MEQEGTPTSAKPHLSPAGDRAPNPVEHALDDAQRQLDSLSAELDQSRQLGVLGVMVSMIAHEVNNLMTPVLSYAQLALAKPDDAALTKKALERAAAGAMHASQISSSILALAKDAAGAGGGSHGLHPATDLKAAIVDAVENVAESMMDHQIELSMDIEPRLSVRARPIVVQQIVLNLVLNAQRAMKSLGGQIRIGAWRVEATLGDSRATTDCSTWNSNLGSIPRAWSRIEVCDTGPGLPSPIAGKLFSPFVRDTSPAATPGTGLGLAICRALAESVGGSIHAEPQLPVGTRFVIMLPAA